MVSAIKPGSLAVLLLPPDCTHAKGSFQWLESGITNFDGELCFLSKLRLECKQNRVTSDLTNSSSLFNPDDPYVSASFCAISLLFFIERKMPWTRKTQAKKDWASCSGPNGEAFPMRYLWVVFQFIAFGSFHRRVTGLVPTWTHVNSMWPQSVFPPFCKLLLTKLTL